jgi:hypothetical protein
MHVPLSKWEIPTVTGLISARIYGADARNIGAILQDSIVLVIFHCFMANF